MFFWRTRSFQASVAEELKCNVTTGSRLCGGGVTASSTINPGKSLLPVQRAPSDVITIFTCCCEGNNVEGEAKSEQKTPFISMLDYKQTRFYYWNSSTCKLKCWREIHIISYCCVYSAVGIFMFVLCFLLLWEELLELRLTSFIRLWDHQNYPQKKTIWKCSFFSLFKYFLIKFVPVKPQTAYFLPRMNWSVTATLVSWPQGEYWRDTQSGQVSLWEFPNSAV